MAMMPPNKSIHRPGQGSKPHSGSARYLSTSAGSRLSQSMPVRAGRKPRLKLPPQAAQRLPGRPPAAPPRSGRPAAGGTGDQAGRQRRAPAQEIGAGDEGAHAVAEQRHRQAGVGFGGVAAQGVHVGHHLVPAAVGGEMAAQPRRGAVAAVVVGIDGVAGAGQRLGEAVVARRVFAHAVGDQHHGARRAVRQPAGGVQDFPSSAFRWKVCMVLSPFMACFDRAAASGLRRSGGFTAEHGARMLASAIQMSWRWCRQRDGEPGSARCRTYRA